jgi:hypothetical protein
MSQSVRRRQTIDGCDKAVSAAWNGFEIPRLTDPVVERNANLSNAVVEAVMKADAGVVAPEGANGFLAGDQLTRPRHQQGEEHRGLRLEAVNGPVSMDFTGRGVELEMIGPKAHRFS